jgi:Rrf2 family protein
MLSKKSKYAIKALVALAKRSKTSQLMRIAEISKAEKIPQKFLETILLDLKNHGILGSKLGINGGYFLLKPADQIFLTDVIRFTNGPIALIPCASLNFYEKCDDCEDEVNCGIRKVMLDVRKTSLTILSNTSILDIISKEKRLINAKNKVHKLTK